MKKVLVYDICSKPKTMTIEILGSILFNNSILFYDSSTGDKPFFEEHEKGKFEDGYIIVDVTTAEGGKQLEKCMDDNKKGEE